jgi:hypothetical protein
MSSPHDLSAITFFISSTYEDLNSYRSSVIDKIKTASGTIFAQEFFGSRGQEPLQTCLEEVKKSNVFLLILAHRYGSVDKKTGKSFTRLEYEHAVKLKKVILAYIVDDDYPWLPKQFSMQDDYKKLVEFKNQLRKDLTIDDFTTQEDLSAKVMQDLIRELPKHGFKIGSPDSIKEDMGVPELLHRFQSMPHLYSGREFVIQARLGQFEAASDTSCEAFELRRGASISRPLVLEDPSLKAAFNHDLSKVFASDDEAVLFSNIPEDKLVKLKMKTKYGRYGSPVVWEEVVDMSPPLLLSAGVFPMNQKRIVQHKSTETAYKKGLIFLSIKPG